MNDERMKHGAFGWNELMTTDVAAARRFYGALFGWETEDYPVEGMNYSRSQMKKYFSENRMLKLKVK